MRGAMPIEPSFSASALGIVTPWGRASRSEAWFWEVSDKRKRSRLPPEKRAKRVSQNYARLILGPSAAADGVAVNIARPARAVRGTPPRPLHKRIEKCILRLRKEVFLPYAAIEDIYETLSSEKQREVYDFIRFLAAQASRKVSPSSPIESYSDDFSALFGSISDSTFVEPTDTACNDVAGELF